MRGLLILAVRGTLLVAGYLLLTGVMGVDAFGATPLDQRDRGSRVHDGESDRDGTPGENADSYFHRRGYTRLNIPKGHYPPPGECRVWFPDRPPGQQPPPEGCDARVPRGAWLIRHPHQNPDHVHVVAYDERRPGSTLTIGEFRIGTGVFVRVVFDR